MRLEAELDILMEKIFYRWNTDALGIEDVELGDQPSNGTAIMNDQAGQVTLDKERDYLTPLGPDQAVQMAVEKSLTNTKPSESQRIDDIAIFETPNTLSFDGFTAEDVLEESSQNGDDPEDEELVIAIDEGEDYTE